MCGRSAAISGGYERHKCPRVLILSADWGSDKAPRPSKRQPEAMRREMEASDPSALRRGRQRREEYEIAMHLLKRFRKDLTLKDTTRYVARTNSLKCCANRSNSKQAPPRLFRNCRKYIGEELGLLAPDILVTQGRQAEKAVEKAVKEHIHTSPIIFCRISGDPDWYAAVITLGRKKYSG